MALGAWGAHGLDGTLAEIYGETAREATLPGQPPQLAAAKYRGDFLTGVRYQMTHAVALLGLLALPHRTRSLAVAGWCWVAGTVIFSGSLYALVLTATPRWGAVTPIGGVLLLVGWAAVAIAAFQVPRTVPGRG